MTDEHRLHGAHLRRPARATGDHDHHRAQLERHGVRVAFWQCAASPFPDRHCPDQADPWVLLLEKAQQPTRREPAEVPSRERCRYGHGPAHQTRNAAGHPVCRECARLAGIRSRLRRASIAITTLAA